MSTKEAIKRAQQKYKSSRKQFQAMLVNDEEVALVDAAVTKAGGKKAALIAALKMYVEKD